MKKSLKVIATATLAFSMFASVAMAAETTPAPTAATTAAAVKTSKDFTDLVGKDAALLAKIDALLAKGFMDGKSETAFDIEGNMTRAEAAKLVAKIFNLTVGTETTSSFKDVDGTDASLAWAIPFIEAAKKAGIIDGMTDTTFAPKDNVTLGQLATLLVKGFGKAADVKVTTPWYQGYLDVAKANGVDLGTDGAKLATRGDLVVGSFAADAAVQSQTKASLTEAKATGAKAVTVTFNKAVDTTKAVVALTKGTQTVATTAKWSDDKKSAVLTLTDVKLGEGTYTTTLSGLDAAAVDKTTATFTAEDEKVAKLSFVNASDKVAKSTKVTIKVKAENQYGENATITGGSYTAYVAGATSSVKRNDDTGLLELTLDTVNKPGGGTYQSEIDVIPVNIFLTNSSVSVQKTFKVGTEPYVTKVELGSVVYPGGKTALSKKGEVAEVALTLYDQYGDVIPENAIATDRTKPDAVITPFTFDKLVLDKTNSTYDKLKFNLVNNVDKDGEYTATVYIGSASATVTLKAQSSTVATKVEIGSFTGVLAEGDVNKYIPVVAYDAAGNKLSAQDIADNAKDGRFSISISGAGYNAANNGNAAIVQSGEHKGKIELTSITSGSKGVVFVNFGIFNANIQQNVQTSFTVQDARKPETIVLDGSAPAAKGIEGGKSTIKWYVKDQHGEKLGAVNATKVTPTNYKLKVTVTGNTYAAFTTNNDAVWVPGRVGATVAGEDKVFEFNASQFGDFNNKELYLLGQANAALGTKGKVKVELIDTVKNSVLKTVDNSLEIVDKTDLTYSVNALADSFAALDSGSSIADDKELTLADDTAKGLAANGLWAIHSKVARKIAVTAKDKSGNAVAIPGSRVVSASTADGNVAKSVFDANNAWIIGNKAGTTNVTVVFKKFDDNLQDVTLPINVKADAVTVKTITADANKVVTLVTGTPGHTFEASELMNAIKVVDNYGVEYKRETGLSAPLTAITDYIKRYQSLLGVQYVVSDVHGTTGSKVILTGTSVEIQDGVTEFVIKAIAPSGVSATTLIKVNPVVAP